MHNSLVDVLRQHAADQPLRRLYTFLADGEEESGSRSFAELDRRAREIAVWLGANGMIGTTVMLLIGDSLAFVDTFMGCLYGGAVAVPAAVPRPHRSLDGLRSIAQDARVSGVICERAEAARLERALGPSLPGVRWLVVEEADGRAEDWREREVERHDMAFLQYTSGSTGTPKGVIVTHGCLLENEIVIQQSMRLSHESRMISWLPLYHDMGLIGNVLQPLYAGFDSVLMPPIAFLQKPARWLNVISRYRGTISGAPNFAYDLCVDRIPPADRVGLDLSAWTVAYNGSEPVRADTIERFSAAFAPAKFSTRAFYPCYGMAESTLFISGGDPDRAPSVLDVDAAGLARGEMRPAAPEARSRRLVSCGRGGPGTRLALVDPATRLELPPRRVGEIWARGGSIAAGYFRKPKDTEATFCEMLADTGEGPFLRTGDLGFIDGGELYVTGRMKDVIIIRGRNHYPQDLEATAERTSRLLRTGGAVAVAIEAGSQPALALAIELTREGWNSADPDQITAGVREAIASEHGLCAKQVLLVKPGSLPRTTSGKLRRSTCRELIETAQCEVLARAGDALAAPLNLEREAGV